MSHEIYDGFDKQEGTSMAWHGLTDVKPVILVDDNHLTAWDVVLVVLGMLDNAGKFITSAFRQMVCTDKPEIQIGSPVNPDSYSVLTNKGFLAIVKNALAAIPGASIASLGSVCKRSRIFVSLQIPKMESIQAAGREFKPFLNFLSSHDKSAPFILNLGTICTVCNNTFNMNLLDENGKGLRVTVRHTSGMEAALKDIDGIISAYFVSVQKFADTMNAFAQIPITVENARAFFAGFLTDKLSNETAEKSKAETAEISQRKINMIERLTELFQTGKGNAGVNHADLFNAVTDYYSHESSGGDDKFKQVASSEFGSGAAWKSLAWLILQDDKRTAETIVKGHTVLALIPKA